MNADIPFEHHATMEQLEADPKLRDKLDKEFGVMTSYRESIENFRAQEVAELRVNAEMVAEVEQVVDSMGGMDKISVTKSMYNYRFDQSPNDLILKHVL